MDGYDSSTYYTTTTSSSVDAGVFLAMLGLYAVFFVIFYVVYSVFLGMIFKKAGVPAWKAWVPIYNSWIMLELGDQPGWWVLLSFIPFVNIAALVFMYIAMYKIGLKLQKEGWFVILAIFLPIVWLIWLAVDKSTWEGRDGAAQQQPPAVPPTSAQPIA